MPPVAPDRPEDRSAQDASVAPHLPTRRGMLAWSVATSGLLLSGGALRVATSGTTRLQDQTPKPPFQLATIPRSFDGWNYVEGTQTNLDPITTRYTGSTDHVIRTYYDEMTGTALSVLILYGPAEPVTPHTPQVCYPASGYRSMAEPVDRTIQVNDQLSAIFRVGWFAKSGGRSIVRQAVYYSYRLNGGWSPVIPKLRLEQRYAGIFKIQIQRRIMDGELINSDEPIEAFLRHLLPTMERMIAAAAPAQHPAGTSPA